MSKLGIRLGRERVAGLSGRRARVVLPGGREAQGTIEVHPQGEGTYRVCLVDFEAGWIERKGYPEVTLTAAMVEGLELLL